MRKNDTCRVGIIQLTSHDDMEGNIAEIAVLIEKAVKDGAELIFLPENSFYMRREASHKDSDYQPGQGVRYTMAEHLGVLAAQGWAKEFGAWLVIGSISVYEDAAQQRPYNRCVVIDDKGTVAGYYDKIHLFDVELDSGEAFYESARCQPGEKAQMVQTLWGGLGLSICYDVRFPHLYRDLAQAGAVMLSVPAAFTVPTGKAHWHVLLRARAIENGAFVIAPAQCGTHPGGRLSYGHALVVNPWGEVLADLGDKSGYACVNIDLSEVEKVRKTIPSLKNGRKYEVSVHNIIDIN